MVSEDSTGNKQADRHNSGCSRTPISRHMTGSLSGDVDVRIARRPQSVFGDQAILIQPQKTRDRANEATIEYPAGQKLPLIFFDCFQKTRADPRRGGDFVKRNSAHFTFAPKVFAERSRRHPQGPSKI